jgi:hypothetical protein
MCETHKVHFAYIDESGSSGVGGSLTFTLACILVEASRWPDVFDDVIDFRRFLRDQFGLPMRAEMKANYLVHNGGPIRRLKLGESARFAIYRQSLRLQAKLGLSTFAVVIRKDRMALKGLTVDPREVAWEYLLQRLERFTTKGNTQAMLVHDEGEGLLIRKLARRARRIGSAGSAFGTGSLRRPARLLVDDPVSRRSHESYFIQLADLNAYAAFRRIYPPPPRPVHVVPETMWDELATARFAKVNMLSGGPPGIVTWPA